MKSNENNEHTKGKKASTLIDVTKLSIWQHKSGSTYQVVLLANTRTERPDEYPPTVVYRNVDNGSVWSRRLDDWHRSMTHIREHC